MKYLVKYYYIKSDHILATPEFDHEEVVELDSNDKLKSYIESQKDQYGHPFKKKTLFGFNYISHEGAVKILPYKETKVKIKKL